MKIVLLKEVQGLGHAGEVKDVSEGYVRNFLIPRGLANLLNKHSLDALEAQKNKRERLKTKTEKERVKLAKKIGEKIFNIKAKADEKGTLYAKINAKEIAKELNKQGFKISAEDIKLEKAIKNIGEHKVTISLGKEKTEIKIIIS